MLISITASCCNNKIWSNSFISYFHIIWPLNKVKLILYSFRTVLIIAAIFLSFCLFTTFRPEKNDIAADVLAQVIVGLDFNRKHRCINLKSGDKVLFLETNRVLTVNKKAYSISKFTATVCKYKT